MKLHRFYIEKGTYDPLVSGTTTTITSPELLHQVKNVLRLQIGEKVIVFNGDGNEYHASIVSLDKKNQLPLKIEEVTRNNVSLKNEVYLFFSIIKKDNVEWILEKGTEVGVSHFVPIISARSEKKDINIERAMKLVKEATEQCGRNIPPIIHPVMKLEHVFNQFDMSFIVLEKAGVSFKETFLKDISIGLFIGPEGGWTDEELALFEKNKVVKYSLGTTTLRAETAAIVGSAILLNS